MSVPSVREKLRGVNCGSSNRPLGLPLAGIVFLNWSQLSVGLEASVQLADSRRSILLNGGREEANKRQIRVVFRVDVDKINPACDIGVRVRRVRRAGICADEDGSCGWATEK